MLETILNLDALRGDARLRLDDTGAHVIAAPVAGGDARAWTVLPVHTPALELARTLHFDDVSLVYTSERARFVVGGDDRWTLDVDRFAGSPVLSVSQSGATVHLTLTGARFPGTEIPADLHARIYRHRTLGWALELRLVWGSFAATLGLAAFLAGSAKATAPVALDGVVCPLGAASAVVSRGLGVATFTPAWTIAVAGPAIVRLQGFGGDVVRHILTVALLAPGMASLMLAPPERRSALFVGADQPFDLDFWPGAPGDLEFTAAEPPFRWLAIEAGEDAAGPRRLLVAAGDLESALEFGPSADLRRVDGDRYRIPLDRPIFVALFDAAGTRLARGLLAVLGDATRDLHCARVSVLAGRPRGHKPFVLGEIGAVRGLACELAWLAHAARPGGVVAEPVAVADTRVRFVLDAAPAPAREVGEVRVVAGDPLASPLRSASASASSAPVTSSCSPTSSSASAWSPTATPLASSAPATSPASSSTSRPRRSASSRSPRRSATSRPTPSRPRRSPLTSPSPAASHSPSRPAPTRSPTTCPPCSAGTTLASRRTSSRPPPV